MSDVKYSVINYLYKGPKKSKLIYYQLLMILIVTSIGHIAI